MLPVPALEPFDSADYQFEVAWDGLRALAFVGEQAIELRDRRGRDVLAVFPELVGLAQACPPESVLDGEVAICDAEGRPDADELVRRLQAGRAQTAVLAARRPAVFIAYDLLYLRADSLLNHPLTRRQAWLREHARRGSPICPPDPVDGEGIALFDAAVDRGLTGIVAKRKESRYLPGRRSPDWLLIEAVRRDDFLVVGWRPAAAGIGLPFDALALATHDKGELRFVGQVAGGFEGRIRERIMEALRPLFRATSAAAQVPEDAGFRWVEPRLVVRVKFSEWSPDRRLRFPIFVAVRDDVVPGEVQAHGGVTVRLSGDGARRVVVPTLPLG
jgi:bifunctional non-homologous end joining protein LigD